MKTRRVNFTAALVAAGLGTSAAYASGVVEDSLITAKVKTELVAEPATKARQIDVETSKGTVHLSGFVDSAESKTVAERVASAVKGVVAVKNDLDVRTDNRTVGAVIDDAVISTKVKAALAANPQTSAMSINVETHHGTVQLSGKVASDQEKAEATRVAAAVEGVESVENVLTVQG